MKKDCAVIVVDDDPNDLALIDRAFRKAGCGKTVIYTASVKAAREWMEDPEELPPRVVLLDLKLPGESGFDLLAWLRARRAPLGCTPVVLFTSSQEPSDLRRAYDLGANAYFVKPPDFGSLQRIVSTLLDHWVVYNRQPEA